MIYVNQSIAGEEAVKAMAAAHPDVNFYVGLVDSTVDLDGNPQETVMPSIGDVGDQLFGTYAQPLEDEPGELSL